MYKGAQVTRVENPKTTAGFFNVLTFIFTLDIFRKSWKKELEEEDVYHIMDDYKSSKLGAELERSWNYERTKPKVSLTSALLRVYGRQYMFYGIINLIVKTTVMVVQPLATGKLVAYFNPKSQMTINDAYYYSAQIIICTFISAIYTHSYLLSLCQLGLRLRVALCSLIYRKALKLTSNSLISFTSGKIVTMISKDVLVFESALSFTHDLWVGIIQVFVMGYIMYQQIQVSSLFGLSFLIVLIPIQIWIGVKTKNLRLRAAHKTDERLRRIQEILTSIKLIKLYTWEKFFTDMTNKLRTSEMKKLRSIFYLKSIILTISALSQRLSFYICILVFIYMGNLITAEKVFVVITCYGSLRFVLTVAVPMSVSQLAECKSSLKRIKEYLLVEDVDDINKLGIISSESKVFMKNAVVEILEKPVLRSVNLDVTGPKLVGITGPVGSGKSTILKITMNDIMLKSGNVHISGDVSYASQEPWLFPGTVRQNILFGLPYERKRYEEVIRVCALLRDLQVFPDRDNTIVSDKGLNFSKGQQARINLARAIYKKADIYLLDDVLSALDASVSKFVFEECLKGFLKGKLILTVCHNKKFLEGMDRILVIDKHTIYADDTFGNLEQTGIDFGKQASLESEVTDEVTSPEKIANEKENVDETAKMLVSTDRDLDNAAIYGEIKEEGKVKFEVYKQYIKHAGGWRLIPLFLLICIISQIVISYFDIFITKWLKIEENLTAVMSNPNATANQTVMIVQAHNKAMYTYSVIIFIAMGLTIVRLFMFFALTTMASTTLHDSIFSKITTACMAFFDKHLSGNILNRFSKDFGVIDEILPYSYFECIRILFVLIGTSVVIGFINPTLLIPTGIMIIILYILRVWYLQTSRSLKRLEGITRSPVVGYLNSCLEGLTTIRASENQELLKSQFDSHQDLNTSATYMSIATGRAFGFYLDLICAIYISIIVYSFITLDPAKIFSGSVGLAITQAFGLTGLLQWGVRQWTEVENFMTSVERVLEYSTAKPEDHSGINPKNWPNDGLIEYRHVTLRYTNSNKDILHDVSFTIQPGEKVGIIGRTGAGKSSIISVLFRLYDVDGAIVIDGIDIKNVQVETVRSKISIIPQDPVLFCGTIRTNLDPHAKHTDADLWRTLDEVELKHVLEQFPHGLDTEVSEGGANFSVGQRQLICLARAILRNNRILVLDEATANIDPQTDALIQKTIKRLFSDCTILTIAHRLNTIIDSDKIMVVDFGQVVEYDPPKKLLDKKSGIFYTLAQQAGLVS